MASQKLTQQLKRLITSNNVIETAGRNFGSIGSGLKDQTKQNIVAARTDVLKQVLAIETPQEKKGATEMQPGQAVDLTSSSVEQPKPERKPEVAAGIDYFAEIRQSSERLTKRESREIEYQIKQIKEELERLIASSNNIVQMEYAAISVEQAPTSAGKYHLNFLEWMLIIIRNARLKVEDSGAWLSAVGKKGNQKGYWNMFKKHGTTFGMSNERMVATQTG